MIVTDIHHHTDLNEGVQQEPLHMAFLTGDNEAHRFVAHVRRGSTGEKVDLKLAGVQGFFVRGDGTTVIMEGTTEENRAMVTLPEACYTVPGRFSLVVKISQGNTVNTVLYVVGTVSRSRTDVMVDPDDVIPSLDELLAIIANLDSVTAEAEKIVERAEDAEGGALDSAARAETAAAKAEAAWAAFEPAAEETTQTITALSTSTEAAAGRAETAAGVAEAAADRAQTQANRSDAAASQAEESASSTAAGAEAAASSAASAKSSEEASAASASTAARDAEAAEGSAQSASASAIAAANSALEASEAADRAAAAGGVTEEAIQKAVTDYLENNPVQMEETDPTVPDWAKQPNKPVYTADEVGALPADTVLPEEFTLPTASETVKGGVMIGSGLTMTGDVLSVTADLSGGDIAEERVVALEKAVDELRTDVDGKQPAGDYALQSEIPSPYVLPTASATEKGGVIIGSGLTMTGDVLSVVESVSADRVATLEASVAELENAVEQKQPLGDYALRSELPEAYTLPVASADTRGGVRIGEGLVMDGDVLSVTEGVAEDRVAALETDMSSVQTSVSRLTTDVGSLQTDVSALQSGVEALQSAVVMTTEDPGAGAAVDYPDGTVIHVYE